jgi:hypothetical protein
VALGGGGRRWAVPTCRNHADVAEGDGSMTRGTIQGAQTVNNYESGFGPLSGGIR